VEEERWLSRLLEGCNSALERATDPALQVDGQMIAALEQLRRDVEQRLDEARRKAAEPG
jgi:hypothetical protein